MLGLLFNKIETLEPRVGVRPWLPLWEPLITCAVADAPVFDNIVAVQDTQRLDFLLEVLHCGLFVGLQLLHSDQLARVITQWVITTKFNTAKVSLKVGTVSTGVHSTHSNNWTFKVCVCVLCHLLGQTLLFPVVRCSAGAVPQTIFGPRYHDWRLSKLGYVWLTRQHEVWHNLQWNNCFTIFKKIAEMCIAFSAHWLSVKTEAFNENIRAKSFLKVAEMQLNPTTLKNPRRTRKKR